MVLNDADDIKLGSGQVDAVYLGEDLVWPVGAITYEIVAALLYYSSGNILDAGVSGSVYSSNYAYVMGTVQVKRGDTVIETLYNQVLKPQVLNTTDFVVPNDGYTYHGEDIYAYNLGGNETTEVKYSDVRATYRNSDPFTLANHVQQEINEEHVTTSTDWREGTPEILAMEVSGTRYVDLVISDYTASSGRTCPAYGGSTGMSAYGAHQMANYSSTPSYEWVTYSYTYTSGYTYTSSSATGNTRWSDPVRVGNPWDVNDTISVSLPSWLHYNSSNDTLTFDSEDTEVFENGRSYLVVATNGSVTDSERVFQQYNVAETDVTTYDLYCHIQRTTDFPASGGTFAVDYRSNQTRFVEYTSGASTTTTSGVTSSVEATNATPSVATVSGSGTFNISLGSNAGGTKTVTVYVILDTTHSASDWKYQQGAPVVAGILYPTVELLDGRVSMKWEWNTASVQPTYPLEVQITNLVYHYVLTGESTERTSALTGTTTVTFSANETSYAFGNRLPIHLPGASGRNWFTATALTGVYFDPDNQSETFPTDKTFSVAGSPIQP